MSRIGPTALQQLDDLLMQLRMIDGITETRPGIFYLKRIPMLHFHETDGGLVADLKRLPPASGFDRFSACGAPARRKLLLEIATRCRALQKKKTT